MKFALTLILATLIFAPSIINAQSNEQMEAWMSYMTPGKVHEMVAKSDGTWKQEMKMWMAPGAEPVSTTGKSENKMILGGRYQYSTHSSNMMGMPFEGINVLGYDNKREVFQSVWIDNMGTGITMLEGTWDNATKSCTLTGKMLDPMTGEMMNVREIFTMVDDNNQKMEMYITKDGSEFKTMEISWTRE